MRKSNPERTKLLFTILVSLAVIIGLVAFLRSGSFFSQTSNNPQNTTNPPEGSAEQMAEQEKFALEGVENNIKNLLSSKNNWKNDDYSVTILHIDAQFISGNIVSTNKDVPEGVYLATNTDKKSIIFDSKTPNPCSLLEEGVLYPPVVAGMCDSSNTPTEPTPNVIVD